MSTAAPMRPAPWTFAAPWGARGLGGSHLNWCLIGPELAADGIELCFADPSRADPAMLTASTASIALAAERQRQAAARNSRSRILSSAPYETG